jgi:dienelactone hydrolase
MHKHRITYLRLNQIRLSALLLTCLACCILFSCHYQHQGTPLNILPSSVTSSDESFLIKWKIIGPFKFSSRAIEQSNVDSQLEGLNRDYLAQFGHSERQLDSLSDKSFSDLLEKAVAYVSDDGVIPFDHIYPGIPYAVAYAYTDFWSPSEFDIAMEVGSGDGIKLWLNQGLVLSTSNLVSRAAFKYTSIFNIHIKQGHNTLVAKVDHKTDAWALIVSFLSLPRAREIQLNQLDGNLLAQRIVSEKLSLATQVSLSGGLTSAHIEIRNSQGATIRSMILPNGNKGVVPILHLPHGYYEIAIVSGPFVARDSFYRGTVEQVGASIRSLSRRCKSILKYPLALDAALKRYDILTKPQYYKPTDSAWQKKLMLVARQNDLLNRCLLRSNECGKMSGFSLREYISQVDNQPQNYLLYVPPHLEEHPALVVVMPYAEDPSRPFLESSLISWPDDLAEMAHAADVSHVIVAIANGRGTVGDAPLGETDILEMMKEAYNTVKFDRSRIYLYGVCEGGRRALLLAEHFPSLFAAIGTYGPILRPYSSDPASHLWFEQNDVISLAKRLSDTPLVLVRGDLDDQAPPELAAKLLNNIERFGGHTVSLVLHGGMHKQHDLERTIFPRLVAYKRPSQHAIDNPWNDAGAFARTAIPPTSHSLSPLVAEAFASKFIVVVGTAEGYEPNAYKAFLNRWENDFYSRCPSITDRELTPAIARRVNLVFLGIVSADTYAASIINRLPRSKELSSGLRIDLEAEGRLEYAEAFWSDVNPDHIVATVQASAAHWAERDSNLAISGRFQSNLWRLPNSPGGAFRQHP